MSFNKKADKIIKRIEEKLDEIRQKNHIKKSYKYIALAIFIGVGYIFFFLSPLIFDSNSGVRITELNKKIVLKNSKFSIRDEKFSEKNNLLEIKLDLEKTNINFAFDYSFRAISKENTNKELPIEVVKLEDGNIVLLITTPKKWSAIAVDIKEEKMIEVGEERIYIDRDKCYKVDDLEKKSKEEYLIENLKTDIEKVKEKIKKYEEDIEINKLTKKNTEKEIEEIEKQKEFLVGEELEKANSNIEKYKNDIIGLDNANIDLEDKIQEEKEKIKMLNKRIDKAEKELGM